MLLRLIIYEAITVCWVYVYMHTYIDINRYEASCSRNIKCPITIQTQSLDDSQ